MGLSIVALEPPAGSLEDCVVADLVFLRVPDAKAGKNRVHLDLRPDDQAAEVESLRGGASAQRLNRCGRPRAPQRRPPAGQDAARDEGRHQQDLEDHEGYVGPVAERTRQPHRG